MKGKYFLDIIDNTLYSTNSYELFNLYNKLFYEEKKIEFLPVKRQNDCKAEANRESFLRGIEQEKKRIKNKGVCVNERLRHHG